MTPWEVSGTPGLSGQPPKPLAASVLGALNPLIPPVLRCQGPSTAGLNFPWVLRLTGRYKTCEGVNLISQIKSLSAAEDSSAGKALCWDGSC